MSIKQWGDIDGGEDLYLDFPSIAVDKNGNVGVSFGMSGPTQYHAIAFTGRKKNDPQGTMRKIQIAYDPQYAYVGGAAMII